MIEFGVENHHPIESFEGHKKAVGSKPILIFSGDQWDSDSTFVRIQNLFMDFFRGDKTEKISLKGLDHVISCTASEGTIYMRAYSIGFMKSGTKVRHH
jgi:ribosome production factor 2